MNLSRSILATVRILLWACIVSGCCPAFAGTTLERIKSTGTVMIAYQPGPPFAYTPGEGAAPTGYSIELCQRFAEVIRKSLSMKALRIDYLPVASADRLPAIVSGKADMECGSTTNSAERRRSVAFSIPHYITGTRIVVRADSGIDALRDFEGKKLVTTSGSTQFAAISRVNREELLGIQIVQAATVEQALAMVDRGDADGFAMDDILLYALIADQPDPRRFKVIGKFLTVEPLSMILPKGDRELKRIVDDEMRRLIYSGEIYSLYDRWFLKSIPPRNRPLSVPVSYLLRDFWRYPSDWVPD